MTAKAPPPDIGGAAQPENTHSPLHWGAVATGVLALSTASVLIRLANAPALVVGAQRLLLAAAILTPWAWPRVRREWAELDRRQIGLVILSGLALAAHFALWITSLSLTSVASSVILVTTTPIFVALISAVFLGERIQGAQLIAIGVAFAGSVVVSLGDLTLSGDALLGDAMALGGAVATSIYILTGRAVRRRLSTLAYVWPCYSVAGLGLLLSCLGTQQPLTGYDTQSYLAFLALALVPQILGHSCFSWALAHFSPVFVTVAILGEPIGATLLAFLVLGETPPPNALLGGVLILGGILLASGQEGSPAVQSMPSD